MQCPSCNYKENSLEDFIGIFITGKDFKTSLGTYCGLFCCPKCNTVIANFDLDYLQKKKDQYKNKIKDL